MVGRNYQNNYFDFRIFTAGIFNTGIRKVVPSVISLSTVYYSFADSSMWNLPFLNTGNSSKFHKSNFVLLIVEAL